MKINYQMGFPIALCWSTEEFLEEDLQEPKANMLAMRAGRAKPIR